LRLLPCKFVFIVYSLGFRAAAIIKTIIITMKSSKIVLAAIIIVLIIVMIYALVKKPAWSEPSYWLAHFIESPEKVYQRSGGTFDEEAALALDRTTGRQNPNPGEHLLAATIITQNILGQEHRPEIDRNGNPTNRAVERAQLRHDMFGRARDHYLAALRGLNRQMVRPVRPPRPRPLLNGQHATAQAPPRARRRPQPPPPDAGFIVDAALDFAVGGVMNAMQHDPILAVILGGDMHADPGDVLAQMTLFIDMDLAGAANQTRAQIVDQRREAAQQEAKTAAGGAAGAAVAAYVNMATQHTNDSQNSHDTGANGCLRGIMQRLRADQGDLTALPTLDDIESSIRVDWMRLAEGKQKDLDDALAVIVRARNGEKNVAIDATDDEVFRRVWKRADDPRNADMHHKLRQVYFDTLKDCWEVGGIAGRKIVCVNGRTSRMLGSLSMLDWDQRNWDVSTLEQFKNDVFIRTAAMITAEAEQAAKSSNPALAIVGRNYLAKTKEELDAAGEIDERVGDEFAKELKNKIDVLVDAYVAERNALSPGAIPAHMLEGIKFEAKAAVA
jgi:hypothetical protein